MDRFKPQTTSRHQIVSRKGSPSLKIVNQNIHSCRGISGRYRPEKTAALLSRLNPDIVTLQEVDMKKKRSSYLNQARFLAQHLDMTYRFYPLIKNGSEQYGLAILSRYPITDIKLSPLPFSRKTNKSEQRGMMTAIMDTPLGLIRVINTHFSLRAGDRKKQVVSLMEECKTVEKINSPPTVVCGDFNAGPKSLVYKTISATFKDVQLSSTTAGADNGKPKPTFISWYPVRRIDHIFLSPQLQPIRVFVPDDFETKTVSDHLPIVAQIGLSLTDDLSSRSLV